MSRSQKRNLIRILISAVLFLTAWFVPIEDSQRWLSFLPCYLLIGWDILWNACRNLWNRQLLDENFLMALASIGAFCLQEYAEGVAVLLFYQVGEWFQRYAVGKSRRSIRDLMNLRPDYARIQDGDQWKTVNPGEVKVGQTILVQPGEKIPLDGVILRGTSSLDTQALTGESMPRDVVAGDHVLSGCINRQGVLIIRVEQAYESSTVAKILDLVENSSLQKAKTDRLITRFARYYTPIVVLAACLLAVLPPLLQWVPWQESLHRGLLFLVISCPCALVISVPLSFFGGIGGASRQGILIKGAQYIEALAKTKAVVFDKTGTLTHGQFAVKKLCPVGVSSELLLQTAAEAEQFSSHPIALSICEAYGKALSPDGTEQVEEAAGLGICVQTKEKTIRIGKQAWMEQDTVPLPENPDGDTVVYVVLNHRYIGCLLLGDRIKSDAAQTVKTLRGMGISHIAMLTGDSPTASQAVAAQLDVTEVHASLLPTQKVSVTRSLQQKLAGKGSVVFVGDGINDAPVLSCADIGIAMGGLGSDAAMEAADIVLMKDRPSDVVKVMRISKKTIRIVKQNIIFALGIKIFFLILGALGIATMWEAVFADVGVSVLAVANALRTLYISRKA